MSNANRFDLLDEEGSLPDAAKKSKKAVDAPAKKPQEEGGLKENHARANDRGRGRARGGAASGAHRAPKHEGFDRRSGTGRDGGPKRGDQGGYNWGKPGAEADVQPQAEGAPVEGEAPARDVRQDQEPEEEEEPDTGISFDEVMKRRAANKVDDDEKINERQKGEGEDVAGEDYEILNKAEKPVEDIFGAVPAKVKAAKKAKDPKVNNSVSLEEFAKDLPIQRPAYNGPRRGGDRDGGAPRGRGGRGRGRGGSRGDGAPRAPRAEGDRPPRRDAAPQQQRPYRQQAPARNIDLSDNAFPALH